MPPEMDRLRFILLLTDYFHGHWEDPEWGKRSTSQILIALAVNELSSKISDTGVRTTIQEASAQVIAKQSEKIVHTTSK